MRLVGFLLALSIILFSFGSEWYPDFNKGVEKARKEGKLVMVYFYEEGCNYCKYMEEVVFIDPKVSDLMEKSFVVVPVDTDNTPDHLDKRFRALGTPTFMIYDPFRDKIIMQIFGLQESEEFFDYLSSACKKSKVKRC